MLSMHGEDEGFVVIGWVVRTHDDGLNKGKQVTLCPLMVHVIHQQECNVDISPKRTPTSHYVLIRSPTPSSQPSIILLSQLQHLTFIRKRISIISILSIQ
jgi:hypothetical protein